MSEHIRGPDLATLGTILQRARDLAVWVVGDVMLDEYIVGHVERISPEAPVPVLRVRDVEYRLGGAANVARQVAALGAHATLAGIVGRDFAADRIIGMCETSGIDVRALSQLEDRATSRKLRALARHQQLMRLDWEDTTPCPVEIAHWMLERLKKGRAPDIVILSDYAKGVLIPELIGGIAKLVAPASVRIIVDPKRRDFSAYRGASVITPNLHELELAAGRAFDPDDTASIATSARAIAMQAGVDALMVTRGERGMIVVPARERHLSIAARGRSLSDTTGAGDTAVALLAVSLAAGATLDESAQIANAAAGIAVGRVGTTIVQPGEIIRALSGDSSAKILDFDQLAARIDSWRAGGKRIVVTNGCFDLLHAGHLSLLHQAAQCGDVLVVAVNSDVSVQRLKGSGRPLIPERERAAMLAALACVDAVTIFDEDTPLETLRVIRPDVLVKGQDYAIEQVVGRDLVESSGGRVVLVPLLPKKSTTALIERIANHGSRR